MSLAQRKAALLAELAEIKPEVEAGNPDAVKRASEILDTEIPAIDDEISKAEKHAQLVNRIAQAGAVKAKEENAAATLGEHVAKSIVGNVKIGQRGSWSAPEWKAASTMTTPSVIVPGMLTDYDRRIVEQPRRRLVVADLLGSETISGTSLTYYVESATVEGGVGIVAEGGAKPQISFADPTTVTESLSKVAVFYRESDELLEDAAWLASSINNRALYQLALFEENQLLNGNGTSPNMTGIMNRSGIQQQTYTNSIAETIFRARTLVSQNTMFTADAVIINPADYQTLRLWTDDNGQFYAGGPFTGQYGNGGIMEEPNIWGLRTVVTSAIAQGTALVGAFRLGASVIRKGGVRVEMTNSNEDDFTNNLVTVRVEERLALAVRYPAAFVATSLTA